jgi:hypothetical protein
MNLAIPIKSIAMNLLNPNLVKPHYLQLLHGNFLRLEGEELTSFVNSMRKVLSKIKPHQIEQLLQIAWREQLTGAWLAGFKNWTQFTDPIGNLLIPSITCYAGQGYCFALASFATAESADYLCRYLNDYLPQKDKYYDQIWAMSALIWIDKVKGTDYSSKYLEPEGLWESFVADKTQYGGFNIESQNQEFALIMEFRDKWFGDV